MIFDPGVHQKEDGDGEYHPREYAETIHLGYLVSREQDRIRLDSKGDNGRAAWPQAIRQPQRHVAGSRREHTQSNSDGTDNSHPRADSGPTDRLESNHSQAASSDDRRQ